MEIKKTVILVDGSNNYAAMKNLGFPMDYDKLLKLDRFGHIVRPYYFTALPPKTEHSPLRQMVDHLEFNGWSVIQKPTKEWDNNGVIKTKGNMDCELVITAVDVALETDATDIALFSGDGDFKALVVWLQRKGLCVTAYSTRTGDMIADELRRQVDAFVDIATMRNELARLDNAVPVRAERQSFLKKGRAA